MKANLAGWVLTVIVGLGSFSPGSARAVVDPTNSAAFYDWQDLGCRVSPGGAGALASGASGVGGNQAHCTACGGMPVFWVDEPYVSVWVADEPLSYVASGGQSMSFRWTHRQRSRLPDSLYYREWDGAGLHGNDIFVPIRLREEAWTGFDIMTNAVWCHNWWSEIVFWDTNYETVAHYPVTDQYYGSSRAYWPFTSAYTGMIFTGEGGLIFFNGGSASTPNGAANVRVEIMGQTSTGGGPEVPTAYYQIPSPYTDSGTIWVDNPQYGFRVIYPDGSRDEYGFVQLVGDGLPNGFPPIAHDYTARAYLTRRLDAAGRAVRIGYYNVPTRASGTPLYVVGSVVDADGRTNTYSYNATWDRLTQVTDPYGRTASLGYDGTTRMLTSITDAANLTSSFQYSGPVGGAYSGWLTNVTTPYGATGFSYLDEAAAGTTNQYSRRAVLASEAQGAHQLFYYLHAASGLMDATAPSNQVPSVPSRFFDSGSVGSPCPGLNYRNTFYWDRRQFAALSPSLQSGVESPSTLGSALASLTQADSRKARLRHWLLGSDGIAITESLSSERDPSPEAQQPTEGARTWFAYPGQDSANPQKAGSSALASCMARVLPGGATSYVCLDYGSGYFPLARWESYTRTDGSLGARTNWYHYSTNGVDLLSVTNSLGQWLNLAYNTVHQPLFATNALNQVTGFTWDTVTLTTNLSQASLPSGQTVALTYYDPAHPTNWPLTRTSSLLKTITLQPQNLTIQITDYSNGLPRVVQTSGTGLPTLTVTNFWDGLNRLTGSAFPDGTTTSNVYDRLYLGATKDRLGHWTGYGYDALQHLTSITNALTNVTTLGWCDCGVLSSITDALLTNTTTFFYNNQGLLTNIYFPDNSSVTYTLDAIGRVSQVADGQYKALTLGYNNQGLVTGVSNAYGGLQTIVYDAVNRPMQVTDANNVTVTNRFDLLNRLTNRFWADGIGEGFGWSTNGVVAYTNRNGKVTRFTRDGAGRLTGVTNANQEVTRFGYNALNQVTSLLDGRTNGTLWNYNEYGWLMNKTNALGREILRYARDPNGQITNRWTPQFGNTGYAYDEAGNLKTITYPQSSISYAFDALNRLKTMVDGSGTSTFGYTAAGQMQIEDGPWSNDTLTYGYTEGQRTSLSLDSLNFGYGYDNAWRLYSLSSPAGSFGYGYDGQRPMLPTVLNLPNSAWITNHYDSLARLDYTALVNRWGHVMDGYGYTHDALGLRTNLMRDLSLTNSSVTAGYDGVGQLTSWKAREGLTNALRLNEQAAWVYDAAGNVRYRTNGGLIQTFTSDPGNQLTNVARNSTMTVSGVTPVPASSVTVNSLAAQTYGDFTFARTNVTLTSGNNTFTIAAQSATGTNTTSNLTVNLPTSVTLLYDSNGNLTNDGTRSFSYDAENRLATNWVANAWKTEFVYDGLGRRRIARDFGWQGGQWVKTNETRYVYDGYLAVQERDSNNVARVTYTRGLDLSASMAGAGGIGGLLARTDGNGSTFYHADGAGNITGLMDGQQNMAARYLYGAYGRLTGKWGPMADANVVQFSSMPVHRQSGLSLYPFRGYDPSLQRWLQRDPLGEWADTNPYRFIYNNPLSYIDPDGMAPQVVTASYNLNSGAMSVGYADSQFGQGYGIGLHGPLGPGGAITMMTGATMVPGVGEAMDLSVLTDPESRWWELGLAGASLGLNALTDGLLPNAGGFLKAGKKLCKDAAEGGAKDLTYLYQKVGAEGEHLKFGITKNPATRYTQQELGGGRLKIIGEGSREDMLQLERNLHETLPIGPEEAQKFYIQQQIEKGLTPPPYKP